MGSNHFCCSKILEHYLFFCHSLFGPHCCQGSRIIPVDWCHQTTVKKKNLGFYCQVPPLLNLYKLLWHTCWEVRSKMRCMWNLVFILRLWNQWNCLFSFWRWCVYSSVRNACLQVDVDHCFPFSSDIPVTRCGWSFYGTRKQYVCWLYAPVISVYYAV